MQRSIVFLDIDGVLTTHATRCRSGDPLCVARLNRIADATGAAIVVSSSWRNPDIARTLAEWGVTGKVVGITPVLSKVRESGILVSPGRGKEIYQWIISNKYNGHCAILDDENDMWPLMDRLVQTDTYLGLRDEDVERAIALLTRIDADAAQPGRVDGEG